MFCPQCKAEYRPGFIKCSDCHVELVETLAPPDPKGKQLYDQPAELRDADNPVEIARFLDVPRADFALSVLQGSGIEAYIDQPFTGSIAPLYMLALGGVRLFVRAEDKERAIEILQSTEELNRDERADPNDDP